MSFKDALIRSNSTRNLSKYIPNSMYIGTEEYYREKLGDRLPDEVYQFLEIDAQLNKQNQEMNESHINYINSIKQEALNEYNKIMEEFKKREEEGKDEIPIEVGDMCPPTTPPENFFIAK